MRRAIALLLAVCFWTWSLPAAQYTPGPGQLGSHAAGGGGTWTKVNEATIGPISSCNSSCGAQTTSFTSTAGNLVVVSVIGSTNTYVNGATSSGGGTWVGGSSTLCTAYQASTGKVACGYSIQTSGTNSFTIGMSASDTSVYLNFREYHVSSGTISALTIPAGTTSAGCSACTTAAVTTSGGSTLLVAAIAVQNTATGVSGTGWGDFAAPAGDGVADNLNAASGTGATFAQTSGAASMVILGFKAQ